MDFNIDPDVRLYADSVNRVLAKWTPPASVPGLWANAHDEVLAKELGQVGWGTTESSPDFWVVAALELGRAAAPISLIDTASLQGTLMLDSVVRHAGASENVATFAPGRLTLAPFTEGEAVVTLDDSGSVRASGLRFSDVADGERRIDAWKIMTLAYIGGLADGALQIALRHAKARSQFGAPLSSLAVVQQRLADAATTRDALELSAWAGACDVDLDVALWWAGDAACSVTAGAHQVCGAMGFTLELPLHRYHRGAKAAAVWTKRALEELGRA